MKKLLITLFVALLLVSCAKHLTGDIDKDGKVTDNDVLIIQQHIKGISTLSETQQKLADINEDGEIDIFDMIAVQKIILGK